MKKTSATRLMAMAMAVCMVLAMMVVPASAATKHHLELQITEANTSVKESTPAGSKITVSAKSGDLSLGADLTWELVSLLSANFEGDAKTNKSGLWDFESDTMGRTIEAGLNAYRADDGGTAWTAWLGVFENDDAISGGDKGSLVDLLEQGATVGDMTVNKKYQLVYTPGDSVQLAPGVTVTVANDDPAKENIYTFTLKLVQTVIGGGGGGGITVKDYAVTVGTVANGTAAADTARAEAGDKVTVTVTANEGYEVDTVQVTRGTEQIAVTDNGDGTYSFTMPAGAVSVTVTTKEKTVVPVDPYDPSAPGHSDNCKAADYDDVDLNEWYHRAVCYVLDKGLMAGYNADTFGPHDPLSRAMVAQLFYNMEGKPQGDHDNRFPDVEEDMWYRDAISWAYANGVVSGYGDGQYRPNKDVTREELVQIFCNYAKVKGWADADHADLGTFEDDHHVADWHEEAVKWGIGAGLLSGKGGNLIAPRDNAIRAEAAQMLMNFCEEIKK